MLGGLAWDLGEPGALLLNDGAAQAASFALEEGGDAATLEITAGDATIEATLSPRTAELPLGDAGDLAVVVGVADVRTARTAHRASSAPGRSAAGAATRSRAQAPSATWRSTPGDESFAGGGGARGARCRPWRGADRRAWLIRGRIESRFEDAFVSTQYDGEAEPTRAGLELWPEEAERASRAAATRVAAAPLGGIRLGRAWAGLFRCQTDGILGLGSYLLWRA